VDQGYFKRSEKKRKRNEAALQLLCLQGIISKHLDFLPKEIEQSVVKKLIV